MRRFVISAAVVGGVVVVTRVLGPKLHERMLAMCKSEAEPHMCTKAEKVEVVSA